MYGPRISRNAKTRQPDAGLVLGLRAQRQTRIRLTTLRAGAMATSFFCACHAPKTHVLAAQYGEIEKLSIILSALSRQYIRYEIEAHTSNLIFNSDNLFCSRAYSCYNVPFKITEACHKQSIFKLNTNDSEQTT